MKSLIGKYMWSFGECSGVLVLGIGENVCLLEMIGNGYWNKRDGEKIVLDIRDLSIYCDAILDTKEELMHVIELYKKADKIYDEQYKKAMKEFNERESERKASLSWWERMFYKPNMFLVNGSTREIFDELMAEWKNAKNK